MSMDKTYNSMDIKNALHAVDVPIPSESAFRYAKFDSEKAFGRLQTAREIKRALVDGINEYADDLPMELMNRAIHIATTILLGCLIFAAIIAHIKYMCWERQCFAVGGEWIVYFIAAVGFGWWVIDNDY